MGENQRVKLTKKILKDTIAELLQKKDIDQISVTAICDAAEINRTTFYRHYDSQFALMDDMINDYAEIIKECNEAVSRDSKVSDKAVLNVLTYLYEHREMNRFLIMNPGIIDKLLNNLAGIPESNMYHALQNKNYSKFEQDMIITYMMVGSGAIIKKWIESGMKENPEVVANLLMSISTKIVLR